MLTPFPLAIFLRSGDALAVFRGALSPFGAARRWVAVGRVAVAALAVLAAFASDAQKTLTPLQSFAAGVILITWTLCIVEPIFRMWLTSIPRRAAEADRLRSLALVHRAASAEVCGAGKINELATRVVVEADAGVEVELAEAEPAA